MRAGRTAAGRGERTRARRAGGRNARRPSVTGVRDAGSHSSFGSDEQRQMFQNVWAEALQGTAPRPGIGAGKLPFHPRRVRPGRVRN